MYPVSEKYIEAIRAPVREDRITGGIRLKDGTIIPVDDSIIVQKSLTVTRKVSSSSKFDIGTVNSAEMRIKIRDAKAYDHDFGGAVISLKYGIVTATADDGSETWEDVPLPPFYVDGGEAARKQNMVSLTAHDTLSRLAVDKGSPPTTSFYAALTYFCNRCNVGVAISESDFNALPNADITPDFSAESIQSCWDGVMWIAQTVNCCAFADYRGLVQLKQYKYEGGDNYDRLITGKERTNIEYSDTRTYLAYLQSYEGENVKLYSRVKTWTGTDAPHIKEGALNLPKNPVVQSLSAEQQAAINQSYLNNRSYPTRYVKASGVPDPAIEPLDVLAFSGGTIDIGQIISVATQVTWKYRNGGTIYCANADEYSDAADGTSAIATLSLESDVAKQSDEAPVMRTQPKSQTEKQIDELRKQLSKSGGTAEKLQTTGSKYWAVTDDSGVSFGTDDSGKIAFLTKQGTGTGFRLGAYGNTGMEFKGSGLGKIRLYDQSDGNCYLYVESGAEFPINICTSDGESWSDHTSIRVFNGGKLRVYPDSLTIQTESRTTLTLKITSDGWSLGTTGKMLEAKSDGLYFNGKKVLLEG
jgi:hypothetical protein